MENRKSLGWNQKIAPISFKDLCRHKIFQTVCRIWNRFSNVSSPNRNEKIVRKQRMFSPTFWIKNIKLFNDKRIKNRKVIDEKIDFEWQNSKTFNKNDDSLLNITSEHAALMTKLHLHLIARASKLVQNAKNSKFAGFFSPIRLRNRIKRGDFNRIAWSPQAFDRNRINDWEQISMWYKKLNHLNNENSSEDLNNCCSFNSKNKAPERNILNIDSVTKSIKVKFNRNNRVKSISKECQDCKIGKISNNNENFFRTHDN